MKNSCARWQKVTERRGACKSVSHRDNKERGIHYEAQVDNFLAFVLGDNVEGERLRRGTKIVCRERGRKNAEMVEGSYELS